MSQRTPTNKSSTWYENYMIEGISKLLIGYTILMVLVSQVGCTERELAVERMEPVFAPLVEQIDQGQGAQLHSLLVWQDNALVFEAYKPGSGFDGTEKTKNVPVGYDQLHNLHSVTKSFIATLIFIAIDEGRIASIDTPVLDFFPEYQGADSITKRTITLADVLNMSTGYALDELAIEYSDRGNVFNRHYYAHDLTAQFLETELAFTPGTQFVYSGLSTVGLSKIIERVYQQPFTQVMDQKLFAPLGISEFQWLTQSGSGEAGADWGLRLTSRDMGKFGLMWLNRGEFRGQIILKPHWFEQIREARFQQHGFGYGMHFWQLPGKEELVSAVGIGEQYITIVPNRRAVIVATGGNYQDNKDSVLSLVQQAAMLL